MTRGLVAVTGGDGFIGSHLVTSLARAGMRIRLLDVSSPRRPEVKRLVQTGAVEARMIQCNGDERNDSVRALEGVTAIFHLRYRMPSLPEGPARFAEESASNCAYTSHLLWAAERAGVEQVCFASSTSVYAPSELPAGEQAPVRTEPSYAAAKLIQERAVMQWASRTSSTGTVLRLSTVYGPGETVPRAIPTFIRAALSGSPLTVNSSGVFDPVYVGDVACAFHQAFTKAESGIYNIGSGEAWRAHDVADLVVGITRSSSSIEVCQTSGDRHPVPDVTLAASALGFHATTPLPSGLAAEIAWFRDGAPTAMQQTGRLPEGAV